ncbi:unnamed protein product [Amoebophrya sp. A25]|nr:unnamed protein product [Amoebophrya sp. A25]|eukprot:GSA25T00007728001.1
MAYRPESGNVADEIRHDKTGKLRKLLKQREKIAEKTEAAKDQLEEKLKRRKLNLTKSDNFGSSTADVLEEEFKAQTVGLTSIEEFREKRRNIDELIEKAEQRKDPVQKKQIVQTVKKSTLSFADEDDEEEEDSKDKDEDDDEDDVDEDGFPLTSNKPKTKPNEQKGGASSSMRPPGNFPIRSKKNPNVDTSFLKDELRDREMVQKREALVEEYRQREEQTKKELIDIVYSYWDGSGHRRSLSIERGASIGQFLKVARLQLLEDFAVLRHIASDELLYVKEDLILPHKVTFYELIRDQVRGKSGPLFSFGVREDVTEAADIRQERQETHAGKIVQRSWYEANKHVFPQKRWELYDPSVSYKTYSVKGNANKHKQQANEPLPEVIQQIRQKELERSKIGSGASNGVLLGYGPR